MRIEDDEMQGPVVHLDGQYDRIRVAIPGGILNLNVRDGRLLVNFDGRTDKFALAVHPRAANTLEIEAVRP